MLGWCPRPLLQHQTSSRQTCRTQSDEIVRLSAFDDEKPVLQPPHQIVIGFDLGSDSSKRLACESPRSVLEPHQLHCPQAGSPLTPLSALGSLLADRVCVGSTVKAKDFTADDHSYQPVLKSGYVACGADGYKVLESVTPYIHSRVTAIKNQQQETPSHGTEHRANHCFDIIFGIDDEDELDDSAAEIVMVKPSFSAASPVLNNSAFGDHSVNFLSKCFRCRRRLVQGKDIFMYRGDQAFCSQECRYKQIVTDERKDKNHAIAP